MGIRHSLIKKIGLVVGLLTASAGISAQTASITLSESSAQLGYGFLVGGSSYGRNEFKVDFLYNSDNVYLLDVSLQVFDEVGSKVRGLTAGVGGKLYGATLRDAKLEMLSLGVGGMLRYALPQEKRLIFGVDGYYAPPIVSFLDAERFFEVAGRIEYEILPTASVYLEYRQFTMEHNNKDLDFEEGGRLGMEINF